MSMSVSRRRFLQAGSLLSLGLGLSEGARLRAVASDRSQRPQPAGGRHPRHPRLTHRRAVAHGHLRPQARRTGRVSRGLRAEPIKELL